MEGGEGNQVCPCNGKITKRGKRSQRKRGMYHINGIFQLCLINIQRILNEKLAQARSNRKRLVNEYKQTKQEMADYQRVQEEERQREFDEIKKEQDKAWLFIGVL